MTELKSSRLISILSELEPSVIAFSGGVDSSFLVYMATKLKKPRMIAVTISTPYIPEREVREAVKFAADYHMEHRVLEMRFDEMIRHNPRDRCYLCKKILFGKIAEFAGSMGYPVLLDGTNADDSGEIRPGIRALRELSVRSPLAEAGLSKDEIRKLLLKEGLQIWDKPAMACLLTRIPYETEITPALLKMIENAEDYLLLKGYPGTRVRIHGDVARIECMPGYLTRIINDPEKDQIVADLKKLGFRYISLDMEGYRTGSMNPENYTK
ncbi:MAG: ATP-dependent sacrificial sulfur transferase LarE [Bacteroidales bacterium]|nr:ATP-dependent sacrificial sulfur transferase LarE [Bacteroidales bacterium]MBN2632589.1 ATP-dependent sacrificial sulfur transferase LarE [Bacteroidales bacterium]